MGSLALDLSAEDRFGEDLDGGRPYTAKECQFALALSSGVKSNKDFQLRPFVQPDMTFRIMVVVQLDYAHARSTIRTQKGDPSTISTSLQATYLVVAVHV